MARPALADLADLEALVGTITDRTAAEARLAQASEIVRAYAGVSWLTDAGELDPDVPEQIAGVVAAMVERATLNPSGTTQESAGPFSRSFGSDAAQRLYMTAGERMVVRAAAGRRSIGTISTTRGDLETRPVGRLYVESFVWDEPSLPAGWPQ